MTTSPSISVVIPTYRRCASVQRALQALARQTVPADEYEVIASIDGSEDGTREMVARFSAPYRLRALWQPNRGRAAACNAGIGAACGEVLVLLDDDMEPMPEFLAAHRREHPKGSRLGALGAVPIADPSSSPVVRYIGTKFNRHLEKLADPGYGITFRDFYSGNFSIRRDVLLEVGVFDEAFKIYGNEDGELALRLLGAGVRLVYSPEALARQHYTKGFAGLARDNIAKGHTAVLLARKYPNTFRDLKLSTYHQGSRKWRLLRAALLLLSRWWGKTPDMVIGLMEWLEWRRPTQLDLYYGLALDYCYWLGARSALRVQRDAGYALSSPAKSGEEARP
jgi:GT2 family glycosyltransferase